MYKAFPILIPLNKNSKCLLFHISGTILKEFPKQIPADLLATFDGLLLFEEP